MRIKINEIKSLCEQVLKKLGYNEEDSETNKEINEENKAPLENEEDSYNKKSDDQEEEEEEEKKEIEKTKIKFLHPVPSFVWKDMKVYGPFDAGEETEIFPEVAELMIRKARAEKV